MQTSKYSLLLHRLDFSSVGNAILAYTTGKFIIFTMLSMFPGMSPKGVKAKDIQKGWCSVEKNIHALKAVREEESPHNRLSQWENQITCKNGSLVEKPCLKGIHTVLGWREK